MNQSLCFKAGQLWRAWLCHWLYFQGWQIPYRPWEWGHPRFWSPPVPWLQTAGIALLWHSLAVPEKPRDMWSLLYSGKVIFFLGKKKWVKLTLIGEANYFIRNTSKCFLQIDAQVGFVLHKHLLSSLVCQEFFWIPTPLLEVGMPMKIMVVLDNVHLLRSTSLLQTLHVVCQCGGDPLWLYPLEVEFYPLTLHLGHHRSSCNAFGPECTL